MDRNPFLDYLRTHENAGSGALHELFRVLAKRTHPDLGATDSSGFVRLQEHYHEALTELLWRDESREGPGTDALPPREAVLKALYRYKSHLPSMELDARSLPDACSTDFAAALDAAQRYEERARMALSAFDRQFHRMRAVNARYPDVRVKYAILLRGILSFFDYQFMPNAFNLRIARSYLSEIGPVTDFDPSAPPHVRYNRSAPARSALYRMRVWIDDELDRPVATVI